MGFHELSRIQEKQISYQPILIISL